MRQVFISYSHKDAEQAERLANALRNKGIRVFLDRWSIGIGERIAEVLGDGIASSNYVIILASPESMTSKWVRSELDTALYYENEGKGTLLIVKLRECSLPPLVRGKLFLSLKGRIDDEAIEMLVEAVQPNIFLQAGKHRVVDFAGNGGAAKVSPIDYGASFYRIQLSIPHAGAFAGVFWEPLRGSIDVANYTHFQWFMRAEPVGGQIQVKFETKEGWPAHYASLSDSEWNKCQVALKNWGYANWERLERITFTMDDRDLPPVRNSQLVDVRGFEFYRSNSNDMQH